MRTGLLSASLACRDGPLLLCVVMSPAARTLPERSVWLGSPDEWTAILNPSVIVVHRSRILWI